MENNKEYKNKKKTNGEETFKEKKKENRTSRAASQCLAGVVWSMCIFPLCLCCVQVHFTSESFALSATAAAAAAVAVAAVTTNKNIHIKFYCIAVRGLPKRITIFGVGVMGFMRFVVYAPMNN